MKWVSTLAIKSTAVGKQPRHSDGTPWKEHAGLKPGHRHCCCRCCCCWSLAFIAVLVTSCTLVRQRWCCPPARWCCPSPPPAQNRRSCPCCGQGVVWRAELRCGGGRRREGVESGRGGGGSPSACSGYVAPQPGQQRQQELQQHGRPRLLAEWLGQNKSRGVLLPESHLSSTSASASPSASQTALRHSDKHWKFSGRDE